jgi:phosphatidylinositol glycan class C protein
MEEPKPWRKALWCPQYYPDNHTDENFLESLVINADVVQRSYKRVVWATLAIDQQVCLTSIVASVAYQLYQGTLTAHTVFIWEIGLFLGTTSLLTIFSRTHERKTNATRPPLLQRLFQQGASTAALVALTAVLSPVYATLTASISSDTIVTSAAALLVAHLYLNDYKHAPSSSCSSGGGSGSMSDDSSIVINRYCGPSLRGSLGLACAMCSSVLMASQLRQLEDVFALVRLKSCGFFFFFFFFFFLLFLA